MSAPPISINVASMNFALMYVHHTLSFFASRLGFPVANKSRKTKKRLIYCRPGPHFPPSLPHFTSQITSKLVHSIRSFTLFNI